MDATIGGYRNFELTQIEAEWHEGRAFFPEGNGVPVYDELVMVTNAALKSIRASPLHFTRALEDATIFLTNHPGAAWEMFKAAYPDLDDPLNRTALGRHPAALRQAPAALDVAATSASPLHEARA